MVVMESCCCCSVRTGCLVFGVFAVLGGIMQLGRDGKEVARRAITDEFQREEAVDIFYNEIQGTMDVERDEIRNFFEINFYLAIPDSFLCLGVIIAASCLIYGVRSKKRSFLIPVMVVFPLDLIVRICFVVILCINFGIAHPISITVCIIFFYGIIFDIFVWLCVFSHWQELAELECAARAQNNYHIPEKV